MATAKLIYDLFDRHSVIDSYADYSRIDGIRIDSAGDSYRIAANVGRSILGIHIDITVPGGIFSTEGPTRAETSPNFGGMFRTDMNKPPDFGDEAAEGKGHTTRPAAHESLLLPGDPGFHLFEGLHAEVSSLKPLVAGAVATTGVKLDPAQLQLDGRWSIKAHDDATGGTQHWRSTTYEVTGDDGQVFSVELDGTVVTPKGVEPDPLPVFRAGHFSLDGWLPEQLSVDSLVAFSGLHLAVQKLYS